MGKSLTFATFTYPPYSIVNLEETPHLFDGMETRIALEFVRMINATYEVSVDAENEWGEIYENYTGIGILGSVAADRAVMGYGAIYLWSYEYQFVDYSIPYIRTGITCIAPRPHPLPGWLTPILPFTITLWSAVGVSIMAAALSIYFVTKATNLIPIGSHKHHIKSRYSTLWDCVFNALGLLVLQTPPDERITASRMTGPNRHVLIWLSIMFLLITSSYSSGLASILTVPRFGSPIETVNDLAYSNMHWAATHPAWIFSLREARDSRTLLLTSHFQVMTTEELSKHADIGDIAFSVERLPSGNFAVGDYIQEDDVSKRLRLMKQDIYYEHVPTITRKGSPYMEKLNKLIMHLVDTGIILKWEDQVGVVSKFLPVRIQRAISHSRRSAHDDSKIVKLQLRHIQGGLFLLVFGLSFSLLAFILELIFNKLSRI
ncbi:hypothetical protein L9F63_010613 [Diploptera punctata]|uniref:Ionotropic glutamate receptor C-terminal domain-containing protein n=1 Tax=Diploptera punctata TaxID=6984 RepID=A0AAD8AJ50_DIPPU|nr:hypothetical protein L9F63_010613 [Diploptera punctata]